MYSPPLWVHFSPCAPQFSLPFHHLTLCPNCLWGEFCVHKDYLKSWVSVSDWKVYNWSIIKDDILWNEQLKTSARAAATELIQFEKDWLDWTLNKLHTRFCEYVWENLEAKKVKWLPRVFPRFVCRVRMNNSADMEHIWIGDYADPCHILLLLLWVHDVPNSII